MLLLLAAPAAGYAQREGAREVVGDSLCTASERLVFGFDAARSHRIAAVCSVGDTALVYRFGTRDTVQLRFPPQGEAWRQRFGHDAYDRMGGAENEGLHLQHLTFSNQGYCYQVFQESSAGTLHPAVGVRLWAPGSRSATEIRGVNERGDLHAIERFEGLTTEQSCAR